VLNMKNWHRSSPGSVEKGSDPEQYFVALIADTDQADLHVDHQHGSAGAHARPSMTHGLFMEPSSTGLDSHTEAPHRDSSRRTSAVRAWRALLLMTRVRD
jgi:hypothetical protein